MNYIASTEASSSGAVDLACSSLSPLAYYDNNKGSSIAPAGHEMAAMLPRLVSTLQCHLWVIHRPNRPHNLA